MVYQTDGDTTVIWFGVESHDLACLFEIGLNMGNIVWDINSENAQCNLSAPMATWTVWADPMSEATLCHHICNEWGCAAIAWGLTQDNVIALNCLKPRALAAVNSFVIHFGQFICHSFCSQIDSFMTIDVQQIGKVNQKNHSAINCSFDWLTCPVPEKLGLTNCGIEDSLAWRKWRKTRID